MRSRSFIVVALALAFLLVGAVAVYGLDRSARGRIPRGVRVAGIDVGGLDAAQARQRLEREYLSRLRRPIVVRHGRHVFTLTARESRVGADLQGMVDEALAQARLGNAFTRAWRKLTGGRVDASIAPRTRYSKAAVVRVLDRVRHVLDRPAKDASISFSSAGISTVSSHTGAAVLAHRLHEQLDRAVVDPDAPHTLRVGMRRVEPKVSTSDLASRYATALIVDRASYQLKLYKHLKLVKSYSVAIGMQGRETPAGLYHIQNKTINPAWTKPYSDWVPKSEQGTVVPGGTPENPLKARWLGIYNGAGIHGIDPSEYGSIGHAASHGCVRMRIPDVIDLYDRVPVGTPIYIA